MGFAIIIVLLIAVFLITNAILHIIQPFREGFNKATIPVFIWGLLLLALAFFWLKPPVYNWVRWTTLVLPIIGVSILLTQLKQSVNPKWLDYSIICLDIATVCLVLILWVI